MDGIPEKADLLQGRDIGPITLKDFIRKRKAFFGHDQGQDNLKSIGSMVPYQR